MKYYFSIIIFLFLLSSCGNSDTLSDIKQDVYIVKDSETISDENIFIINHEIQKFDEKYFLNVFSKPGSVLLKIIINNAHEERDFIFVSIYNFHKIKFYSKENDSVNIQEEGYYKADTNRNYRLPAFPVKIKNGENVFYVRVDVKFLLFPEFVIMSQESFSKKVTYDYLIIGGVLAIFLVMTIYNFIIYVFVRKTYYLIYVVYLATSVLFNMCYLGVGYNFAGEYSNLITDNWIYWLIINGFAAILFTVMFLELRENSNRIYKLILSLLVIFSAMLVLTYFRPFVSIRAYNIFLILFGLTAIPLGIYRYISGFRPALYFTIAWGTLAIGSIFFNLTITKMIPLTIYGEWAYYFGASAEIVLLSLALGDLLRFKEQKMMRQQADYINKLEVEKKEKSHVYNQLQKVVYKHQISMIKKGAILEDTMPSLKSYGAVIALDIVNSSHMPHEQAQEFFRIFFFRCQEIMLQGYDEEKFVSTAYRIKEMGDGFLCSIGFPFRSPGNVNLGIAAIELSEKFINVFNDIVKDYSLKKEIFCSVAAAIGDLEAFYPIAGVKEYDLYGNGIILAARYEALRKRIFTESSLKSNILTLQGKIFDMVPEFYKSGFSSYDLSGNPIEEDPDEYFAYYKRY